MPMSMTEPGQFPAGDESFFARASRRCAEGSLAVFRIFKLLVGLAGLALFVWFGANVRLGSRTLFQHLQAIGRTHETQDLLEGTRQSAKPIIDSVRKRLGGGASAETDPDKVVPDGGAAPADEISDTDRHRLRKMLGAKAPAPAPR